jgi:DNA replication protein DnaC
VCFGGDDDCVVYQSIENCEECSKVVAEENRKAKIEYEINNISSTLSSFGIPPKLLSIPYQLPQFLESFVPPVGNWSEEFFVKGICLSGSSGVGKTFSMAMLIRDWTIKAIKAEAKFIKGSWMFVNYPSFIMQVQDAYRRTKSEESPLELLESLAKIPFLVLDDLGVEKATEFVKQSTYYILNEREMNLRPTFITTNFTMNQLNELIDQRISSRIVGMCEIKEVKGLDRRITAKNDRRN